MINVTPGLEAQFEIERFCREIDATDDVHQLRHMAKDLLKLWQSQLSATRSLAGSLKQDALRDLRQLL
ncbi:MAG: hypothetical protein ERJ67_05365 [Aphanocapsa feldmannii 277cV]|uniref:Uncharacterized protein n=2 Tax=Aphanocapsa feldmannii TaxID=192050 RepID=A0A524RNM5_9CHRO|nr:MAG: hypothetical protein ERJ69_10330 [Aphanocapsa feldmannii 288cV]TGG92638.1 MAG: hypothetical protein ERJ67_05365 [Aphanocapsa feldmannii 277cV]TGH24022.1 MAG: hypothetical protein ERJ68_03585 [Aphanocapsa feldmannii 277cI]